MIATYAATIWIAGLGAQHVTVQASDIFRAQAMLRMQYAGARITNVRKTQ